jgi:hypothetical protein
MTPVPEDNHDSSALDSQENIPQDAIQSLHDWYDARDRQQDAHDRELDALYEQELLQRETDG